MTGGGGHVAGFADDGLRMFDHVQEQRPHDPRLRVWRHRPVSTPTPASNWAAQTYFHASAEAQFPLPVVPESFGLRGAVFADAATLYGNDITSSTGALDIAGTGMEWRASVGAGLIWASPFGPLRVDYAFPVLKEDDRRGAGIQFRYVDPLLMGG